MKKCRKIMVTGILAAAILAVCSLLWLVFSMGKAEPEGLRGRLTDVQDLYITIGEEEFQFFYGIAGQQFQDRSQTEEVAQAALELAGEVYAQFRMGEELGLCQVYSYSAMCSAMEADNQQRKIKLEQGEVIYGLQEYTPYTYFSYLRNSLRQDIVKALSSGADQGIIREAGKYYKENQNSFVTLQSVRYETDEQGTMEEKLLLRQDMGTLEKTDDELFRFLFEGEEGEELQYLKDGALVCARILERSETLLDWKEDEASIVSDYVDKRLYDELLDEAKKHCLVSCQ